MKNILLEVSRKNICGRNHEYYECRLRLERSRVGLFVEMREKEFCV